MLKYQKKDEAGEQGELFKVSKRKLPPAERVSMLQEKLYRKAKQERENKFYILYDKMCIPILKTARMVLVRSDQQKMQ